MLGSLFLGFRYVRKLQDEGIEIRGIPGPHRAFGRIGVNFRNHRKAVVIDDTVGFTGGINIGQEYINGGKKFDSWRDTHLRIEGSKPQFARGAASVKMGSKRTWRFEAQKRSTVA
jgi:cardiolipin synthase